MWWLVCSVPALTKIKQHKCQGRYLNSRTHEAVRGMVADDVSCSRLPEALRLLRRRHVALVAEDVQLAAAQAQQQLLGLCVHLCVIHEAYTVRGREACARRPAAQQRPARQQADANTGAANTAGAFGQQQSNGSISPAAPLRGRLCHLAASSRPARGGVPAVSGRVCGGRQRL